MLSPSSKTKFYYKNKRCAPLLASLALAIRRFRRRQKQDQKLKRRFWIREFFSGERKEQVEWENLFCELDEDDRESYYNYIRIIALA